MILYIGNQKVSLYLGNVKVTLPDEDKDTSENNSEEKE